MITLLRVLSIIGFLAISILLLAPLQWLARWRGWPLAHVIPVLFSRGLCSAIGVRVHTLGHLPTDQPMLIAANHVSYIDILALGTRKPLCFLAKSEVSRWPVVGWLARLQRTVFVDRGRRRSIPETNRHLAQAMARGDAVVLFAEGTTSDGTRVRRFLSSHFGAAQQLIDVQPEREAVPVQPVAIAYTRQNGLILGRSLRATLAWYGSMTMLPHLWHLLKNGPVDCYVYYCEPLRFVHGAQPKRIAAQAHERVRDAMAGLTSGRLVEAHPARSKIIPQASILLGEN